MERAISLATASTKERSALPVSLCGVPTAIKIACADCVAARRSEVNSSDRPAVAREKLRQILLMNRNSALLQAADLGFVVVDADDMMSDFGKTSRSHQAYIARTHYGNPYLFAFQLPSGQSTPLDTSRNLAGSR